jgi:ERCC4-type nuclease
MKSQTADRAMSMEDGSEFYSATTSRLRVIRNGRSLLRSASIPKPTVIVDSREQHPWPLLASHPNWIGGEFRAVLKCGDYTLQGMENLLALERKSLADLVDCTVTSRARFLACCRRLAKLRWKAILIEASYEDIKRGWDTDEIMSAVHPNSVCGFLDAIEAKFGIPVILTSRDRTLATERAASWLSKHFTYWWLEQNGLGRVLIDSDGL